MSPEVSNDHTNRLARVVQLAERFGSAALLRVVQPSIVPFEHFPGDQREFDHPKDFPGFQVNEAN